MIFFVFAMTAASAQSLVFADTVGNITGLPTDSEGGVYINMTNVTQGTLDLRWERTIVSAPMEWDSWVCTVPGLCGLPDTETLDFEIGPGQQGEFQYHVAPEGAEGTGMIEIKIINNADDELIQTITVNADFTVVDVNEIEEANIKMFPNPATDHFQLVNNQIVDQVEIYNILGKQVKSFGKNVETFFIGDLAKGIYLVKLTDTDSNSTKTLKLKKS